MNAKPIYAAAALLVALVSTLHSAANDFDIKQFGASGDGQADDTAAIQRAVDAAAEAGGTVIFPPGTYLVTSVGLRPGVRYSGYGATIKRPANQGKWVRTFDAGKQGYLYSGDEDAPPLTIEGLTFDGNRQQQADYTGYQLEQAHLINLVADPQRQGRLQASIRECYFKDCVADAVSVYTNVRLKLSDCTARDCFRGGLTVTGGYSQVQASNFTTLGKDHATGIDVEIDGGGYGSSHTVELTLDGLMLQDGDFDIGVGEDSTVVGTNIVAPRGPFNLYGGGTATLKFSNCLFGVGELSSTGNRITLPGKTSFSHCTFRIEGASGESQKRWAAAHVYWSIGDSPAKGQSLVFSDCRFEVGKGTSAKDTTYALYVEADRPENENVLNLRGGQITQDFDHAVFLAQGGRAVLKDFQTQAATALRMGASEHYPLDVVVDGIEVPHCETYLHMVTHVAESRLLHKNVVLDEELNVIGTDYGIVGSQYLGARTILASKSPTEATPGLLGDVYRIKRPQPGEDNEWLCTSSGSGAGAVWKPVRGLEE